MIRTPPETIGPYRILGILGQGGMGVVYRCEHEQHGAQAAVKTVTALNRHDLSGIRAEVQALKRIVHPGVVRILDEGVQGGIPWYAMELLEGQTLRSLLHDIWHSPPSTESTGSTLSDEDRTTLRSSSATDSLPTVVAPPPSHQVALPASLSGRASGGPGPKPAPAAAGRLREVLTLASGICEALTVIHREGIVHRDLKPANVYVRPDGSPVLMDFGLALRARGSVTREALEAAGDVVGTAAYMAPEQVRGLFVDARADLYALGCILYEMVTGRRPFAAATLTVLLQMHIDAPLAPPSSLVTGLPAVFDDLILGLLTKDRRHRTGHADDVAAALAELGVDTNTSGPAKVPRAYLYRPEMAGRADVLRLGFDSVEAMFDLRGGFVLLGGESGVGKTFVAAEIARYGTQRGAQVVLGECLPIDASEEIVHEPKGAPLHPFHRLLQVIANRCLEGGLEVSERLLGPRAKVLAQHEPTLAGLPGQAVHPDPPPLPPEAAAERLLSYLGDTLQALAAEKPLLLVLDDLQWADELSLRFLASLRAHTFTSRSLLIIATYRTEEVTAALRAILEAPFAKVIRLDRLEVETVRTIISDMLAMTSPPDAFVDFLARQSDGNPFFVAEYLRTAVAEGLLYRRRGRWQLASPVGAAHEPEYDALPLPGSLRELLRARLGALSERTRRVAELAAVVGRNLDGGLLSTASEEDETDEAIRELCTREVLEAVGDGQYRFVHDKIREVAYSMLSAERRRLLHLTVGQTLEALPADANGPSPRALHGARVPALAHHYTRAEAWDKALRYCVMAGDQAVKLCAYAEARVHYAGALDALAHLADSDERRREQVDLLIKTVSVSFSAVGPDECLARLVDAETLVKTFIGPERLSDDDRLRLTRIHFWMGRAHFYSGALTEAVDRYQRVLPVARELGDAELLAIPAATLGQVLVIQGRFGQAARLLHQAEASLRTTGYWPEWILNQAYLGAAIGMQGRGEEALDHLTRGAERARAMSSDRGQAEIQLARSLVSFSQGDMRATVEEAQLAVEVAERAGEWLDVYIAYLLRGWAASRLGRHDEASANLVRAEEITQTRLGGMVFMADWIAAAWAEVSLNAGDAERAAERAREAVRIAAANQSLFGAGFAYRVWGVALTPQRFEEAGPHFAESVRAFEDGETWLEAARTELAWGLACKSNGDLTGMREHTEKARVRFGRAGPANFIDRSSIDLSI